MYGIMTQRSDYARPRPYAELDQVLHTLGGYVLLITGEAVYVSVHVTAFTLHTNNNINTFVWGLFHCTTCCRVYAVLVAV